MPKIKPVIFVSHTSADADIALGLSAFLRQLFLGMFDIFVSSDGASIRAGDRWQTRIEASLAGAELMLTVLTPEALERKWIYFETGGAYFLGKRVIPLLCNGLQAGDLEPPLSWLQAIRGYEPVDARRLIIEICRVADLIEPAYDVHALASICSPRRPPRPPREFPLGIEHPARPLPVFLLVDSSGSMAGNRISEVQAALDRLLISIKSDRGAARTVHLGLITFGSEARVLLPLTAVNLIPGLPRLTATGATALGAAIDVLMSELPALSRHVVRPTIFFVLDGEPTDDWRSSFDRLMADPRGSQCQRVCLLVGDDAPIGVAKILGGELLMHLKGIEDLRTLFPHFQFVTVTTSRASTSTSPDLTPIDIPVDVPGSSVSDPARELLLEASQDPNGVIMRSQTLAGSDVQTNHRAFVEAGSARSGAIWPAAIDELYRVGFVEDRTGKGEAFFVTEAGYRAADAFRLGNMP